MRPSLTRWRAIVAGAILLTAAMAPAQADDTVGVVVDSASSNPFGGYLAEILKAEGFGNPQTEALDEITLAKLQSYQTILLAETSLSTPQARIFRDYVSGGGNLIAMRPDGKLDDVFGIAGTAGTLSEGYVKINPATSIGAGLETTQSMKIHGTADGYQLASGTTKLASLYSDSATDTGYASVVRSSYGSGQAVAFSYDLASSIVYTRQGNPAWAGQNRDGDARLRASDLFYDTAGSTHWNDTTKADILQADEQMRLLTHSIESTSASTTPLPRLWYFPDAKKSVLVWTGDQDNGSVQNIDDELSAVKDRGGNGSIYRMGPKPTATQVTTWDDEGHEIGVHVNDAVEDPNATWSVMDGVYTSQLASFHSDYPTTPMQKSVRNHGVKWCSTDASGQPEFAAQAQIELNHGIEMDFNYYWNGSKWLQTGQSGYTNASGLPMRFATSGGETLDVFQADTQLTDEGWEYSALYNHQAYVAYQGMLNASVNQGKYAWIVANFHPCVWDEDLGSQYNCQVEGLQILDLAAANDIPIFSGEQMNSFVRMRDAAEFQDVQWNGRALSFVVDAPISGEGMLTVMVPNSFAGDAMEGIFVGGTNVTYTVETIAGVDYALFLVDSGTHAISALYTLVPGDATRDGIVDAADAQRLADHWGADTLDPELTWWEMGDFNNDQLVNAVDAAILTANWDVPDEGNLATIPEPTAFALLLGATALTLGRRRRPCSKPDRLSWRR